MILREINAKDMTLIDNAAVWNGTSSEIVR